MARISSALVGLTVLLSALVQASVVTPPVLPLVVRTPYLNTHLTNAREAPWTKWPIFWTGQEVGMSMMASVPGTDVVYPLLGRPQDSLGNGGEGRGCNVSEPKYLGAQYDASTTNLTYQIPAPEDSDSSRSLDLLVSFLSPITPQSTLRQAIPASYVEITTSGEFEVDVYMDLNGMWVTAERNAEITWELDEFKHEDHSALRSWKVKRKHEMKFAEIRDRAEYGRLVFTADTDTTFEAGTSAVLRHQFAKHGKLRNRVDSNHRRVMDEEPVFAFHKSIPAHKASSGALSSNNSASTRGLFTIAHIRDEVAQFASARGLTEMRPFYASYFREDHALLAYHYSDYQHVKTLADAWSEQMSKDAHKTGGQDHADILAVTARQVMGGTDFTGTPDNPLLFIKEISSDGNCQTIDVIFPAFPFFTYANPRWLAYMLEPLLEHMLSGQYPNKYAMHDLGFHYPNLTGHPLGLDEYMPVEESGDMLILGLSLVHSVIEGASTKFYSLGETFANVFTSSVDDNAGAFPLQVIQDQASGIDNLDRPWADAEKALSAGKSWLNKSYKLWKQWTEYLVEFALEPENQLSTDDFAGWLPLQTNLALKGIVGIKAMSELAAVMGEHDDVKYYKNVSDTYIEKWQDYGMSRDGSHAKLAYNWYSSWTTLYSLFADSLLCFHSSSSNSSSTTPLASPSQPQAPLTPPTSDHNKHSSNNFIPHSIYKKQSAFYTMALQKYGLPLDQRHFYTKSDWEFQAIAAASPALQKEIVKRTARWLNETNTDTPFSDLYVTEFEGEYAPGTHFTARPVVGSHFSILAMDKACGGGAREGLREWEEEVEAERLGAMGHDEWTVKGARNEAERATAGPFVYGSGYLFESEVIQEIGL